ncbi:MAG TPA: sigma-70 family RNA polymerase sigma factor [Gemmataceae bacterium]|nr:sigma-70 family RNA polymerase sigma factor [Gemmataceae bacterium]
MLPTAPSRAERAGLCRRTTFYGRLVGCNTSTVCGGCKCAIFWKAFSSGPEHERIWGILLSRIQGAAEACCRFYGASRDEAQDIAQQAALTFLKKPASLIAGLYAADNPGAYLATAVWRVAASYWRSARRAAPHGAQLAIEALAEVPDHHALLEAWIDHESLRELMATLRAADKELLQLRFDDGLTVPQIADRLGLSRSAVEMRLLRLLGQLQARQAG